MVVTALANTLARTTAHRCRRNSPIYLKSTQTITAARARHGRIYDTRTRYVTRTVRVELGSAFGRGDKTDGDKLIRCNALSRDTGGRNAQFTLYDLFVHLDKVVLDDVYCSGETSLDECAVRLE